MKRFSELFESDRVTTKVAGRDTEDDNQSVKHDVHHGGKHIASLYHHPDPGFKAGRWEVMKPHSNKDWEEDYGDHHHDYDNHPLTYFTKKEAVDAVKKQHKIN